MGVSVTEIDGIVHPADSVYTPQTATPLFPVPRAGDLLLFRADVSNAVIAQAVRDGDGFAFDADSLERLAAMWDDLAHRYTEAVRLGRDLVSVEGPGLEYASTNHAERLRASGQALQQALSERARYCEDLRDKFHAAHGRYVNAEDDAEATVTQEKGKFE